MTNTEKTAVRRCSICSGPLNLPSDPTTRSCGGDCLRCMAEHGDPDCVRSLKAAAENRDPPAA